MSGRGPLDRPAAPADPSAGRPSPACSAERGGGSSWPLSGSTRRPSMSGGGDQPVPIRLVAGPAPVAQPGDAGRRVARTALVVRRPPPRRGDPPSADASGSSPSQANGRGAAGSSGAGGCRQGGTLPTSGTRCCSWPIRSTRPWASARLGREDLGRRSVPRPPEELGEPAIGLEVAADHHRVVRLERLGHPVHQRPREARARSRPRGPPSARGT